jgi:(1->4)-alpha-D-glucan 1-alpha-D-glucosylmutase
VFDFIASVLLLEHPPTLTDEQAIERREFALNIQQVTGPVAAKGVEDTAFYRYYPLASLNEVGGELDARPLAVDEFHRMMRHRIEAWPHTLSATSTHDSKRGEDFRARLHVLSEASADWIDAFQRWQIMNRLLIRELDGESVPDANEEYLLYQTLVGTWPHDPMDARQREQYRDRILQYMEKALREAKIHTSWMNPMEAYEAAVSGFIRDLLGDQGKTFADELNGFVRQIADSGFVNSLAQLVLKMTLPGVPDFYQGTELWDFNLVDPDNRRPVDFERRRHNLEQLLADADRDDARVASELSRRWPDADTKLWITSRGLALRREWAEVFSLGDYVAIAALGAAADHVISFARRWEQNWVIVAVPRHFYRLLKQRPAEVGPGMPQADWAGTQLLLPDSSPTAWRCELSGRTLEASAANSGSGLDVANLFAVLPVAILTANSE